MIFSLVYVRNFKNHQDIEKASNHFILFLIKINVIAQSVHFRKQNSGRWSLCKARLVSAALVL